ncbi:MAG: bestrophin family protein [Cytophagales bacterium]
MIVYDSNKNWFKDISNLARSWTMVKIVRSVVALGLYTLIICVLHVELFPESYKTYVGSVFSLLGIVLSILLVFRTNTAYDKWWEGRKQWGALVNNTRNLAVYAHSQLPESDKPIRRYLAIHISNFCLSLVDHLRNGVVLKNLIMLGEGEIKVYKSKNHIPNFVSMQIQKCLHDAYKRGEMTEADMINIRPMHQSLLDILGACERIKKTPIPFSYSVYIKIFILAYGLMLPFALVSEMQYWAIPAVMFVFFAFIGVEMMGGEIEEPFGLDCNDLPTGTIANTIKENVFEILEVDMHEECKASPEIYQKIF